MTDLLFFMPVDLSWLIKSPIGETCVSGATQRISSAFTNLSHQWLFTKPSINLFTTTYFHSANITNHRHHTLMPNSLIINPTKSSIAHVCLTKLHPQATHRRQLLSSPILLKSRYHALIRSIVNPNSSLKRFCKRSHTILLIAASDFSF